MIRMLFGAVVLALSACGAAADPGPCAGMDPAECAVTRFGSIVGAGKIGAACMETVLSAQIVTFEPITLQSQCGSPYPCDGCLLDYRADGPLIGVSSSDSGQTVRVAAHELMHVILQCTSSDHDPDAAHRKAVWGELNPST